MYVRSRNKEIGAVAEYRTYVRTDPLLRIGNRGADPSNTTNSIDVPPPAAGTLAQLLSILLFFRKSQTGYLVGLSS